jgi:hypothetical protein
LAWARGLRFVVQHLFELRAMHREEFAVDVRESM